MRLIRNSKGRRQPGTERTAVLRVAWLGNGRHIRRCQAFRAAVAMADDGKVGEQCLVLSLRVEHDGVVADKRARVQKHGKHRQ